MAPTATARQRETRTDSLDLMTVKDVEAATPFDKQSLYLMRVRGDGPPFIRTPSGRIFYRRRDLVAWLDAHVTTQL